MAGDIEVGVETILTPSADFIPGYLEGGGLMAQGLTRFIGLIDGGSH